MAPQVVAHPGTRPTATKGGTVDEHTISPAGDGFYAKGLHDEQDHPHACIDGWVFLGRIVESEHDLDGEVVEYERVPCRRCVDSR
jgi:hypothetical protein